MQLVMQPSVRQALQLNVTMISRTCTNGEPENRFSLYVRRLRIPSSDSSSLLPVPTGTYLVCGWLGVNPFQRAILNTVDSKGSNFASIDVRA